LARDGASFLRKFLFVLLIGPVLFASDQNLATKIYLSIAKELSKKDKPLFYIHGEVEHLRNNKKISLTHTCDQADIIVLNTLSRLPKHCDKKLIFTNSYRVYLKNENILGAFFWQKGRPNIVFRGSSLKKMKIKLKPSFNKYID